MLRLVIATLALVLIALLSACEPIHPPPEGWVESCYGGSIKDNLNGSIPHVAIRIRAAESDWPKLHSDLSNVGKSLGLDVFDSSLNLDHIRVFGLGICSRDGLFIDADGRIYKQDIGHLPYDYEYVSLFVYTYGDGYDWPQVANALVNMIEQEWASVSEVEWRDQSSVE